MSQHYASIFVFPLESIKQMDSLFNLLQSLEALDYRKPFFAWFLGIVVSKTKVLVTLWMLEYRYFLNNFLWSVSMYLRLWRRNQINHLILWRLYFPERLAVTFLRPKWGKFPSLLSWNFICCFIKYLKILHSYT